MTIDVHTGAPVSEPPAFIGRPTVSAARWDAVAAPHGIASLRHTHWLDAEFRAYPDAPGTWAARDGRVLGRLPAEAGTAFEEIQLPPGGEIGAGRSRLRAIDRDGALALRVFDPEAPTRTTLRGIHAFPRGEAWVIVGTFVPAADGAVRIVRTVDGHEREEPAVGVVDLRVAGQRARLTVSASGDGFSAVFADSAAGDGTYRFRFLPIDAPDADGTVVVDFNRAFLPPCAFSDQYVCPLPPEGNRLGIRVAAGERLPDREPAAIDT